MISYFYFRLPANIVNRAGTTPSTTATSSSSNSTPEPDLRPPKRNNFSIFCHNLRQLFCIFVKQHFWIILALQCQPVAASAAAAAVAICWKINNIWANALITFHSKSFLSYQKFLSSRQVSILSDTQTWKKMFIFFTLIVGVLSIAYALSLLYSKCDSKPKNGIYSQTSMAYPVKFVIFYLLITLKKVRAVAGSHQGVAKYSESYTDFRMSWIIFDNNY